MQFIGLKYIIFSDIFNETMIYTKKLIVDYFS